MDKSEFKILALLFLFSFVLRIWISFSINQFILDEPVYARTIDEFIANPAPMPTYLGLPASWKPPLLYYIYSPFVKLFELIGVPVEIAYRLPTVIISSASVIIFYFFLKTFMEKQSALMAAAIYSVFGLSILMGGLLMTDSLLMFFIFLGMLFYAKGTEKDEYFLLAGVCSFLAFLTKYHVALMLPLLGASYCFHKRRELLMNKFFIISLMGVPLAFLTNLIIFAVGGGLNDFLFTYRYELFERGSASMVAIAINFFLFLYFSLPWVGFVIFGYKSKWEQPEWRTVFLWLAFAIVVILNRDPFVFWYSLPILPAIAAISANVIGGGRLQFAVLVLTVPLSFLIFSSSLPALSDQKEAGLYLAGKGNSLIIAPEFHFISWPNYYELHPNSPLPLSMSGPGIAFYKLHNEIGGTSKISAGYLPTNETDVNHLVSNYIKNSNASSIAIAFQMPCIQENVSSTKPTNCYYDYVIPDDFEIEATKNKEYLLLNRK